MDVSMISPDMIAFGPDMLNLIEIELQSRRITYKEIAAKIHTATGTVGSWFSRGTIPTDKLWMVISAVGSARLWMQALAIIPGNAFRDQYLDGTDDHPLVTLDEAIDMAEAFIQQAQKCKSVIRNKKDGYQFRGDEDICITDLEDSVADYLVIGKMVLIRFEDHYHRPARVVMERQAERMRERGYLQEQKRKAVC